MEGARGRTTVDERRSEDSGVEKDEVLGFNPLQRARQRQMWRQEVAGGTPALLLFQFQQSSSSNLNSFLLDVTAQARRHV